MNVSRLTRLAAPVNCHWNGTVPPIGSVRRLSVIVGRGLASASIWYGTASSRATPRIWNSKRKIAMNQLPPPPLMNSWTSKNVKAPTMPFQMRQTIVMVMSLPIGEAVGCSTTGPRSVTVAIEPASSARARSGMSAVCRAARVAEN